MAARLVPEYIDSPTVVMPEETHSEAPSMELIS